MKKSNIQTLVLFAAFWWNNGLAQEMLKPLGGNINYLFQELQLQATDQKQIQHRNKAAIGLELPFKEDFHYAPELSYPDQSLWSDSSTYVNTGHAIAPPSIGVATFDGLNKKGYPYTPNLLNMSQSLPADTLTSKEINLHTVNTQTLQPSDSVAITFYYQARGFGDSPELTDSLLLDFYQPLAPVINGTVITYGKWINNVWFKRGNSNANTNDTIFKRGFVWISDTAYLHDGFKFRFRNKATTAGDFDHWHLDYIYINKGRSMKADTSYDDISFGYVPTPLLRRYAAMPWQQYIPSERASKTSVFIRNNGDSPFNMTYENRMFDQFGALTHTYTGGANPALGVFRYSGWNILPPHAAPAFEYTFAPFTDSSDFTIKHFLYRSGAASDFFPENDTVLQFQKFRNYYAFDDGSAEAAYFVSGTGARMALRFTVNVEDTLRAVRIFFDPIGSLSLVESYEFNLILWSPSGAIPGTVLYRDTLLKPKYLGAGFNVGPEYQLSNPKVLAPGDYFIGIQQKAAAGIGIGFDRNLNHMQNLYYDSGSGWTQSQIAGSLMLRPVFGQKIVPPVGISERNGKPLNKQFLFYPNPANTMATVMSKQEGQNFSWQIFNGLGELITENFEEANSHQVNTSLFSNGIYFLILKSGRKVIDTQKIIIQH
jgi:hypothetical protein